MLSLLFFYSKSDCFTQAADATVADIGVIAAGCFFVRVSERLQL